MNLLMSHCNLAPLKLISNQLVYNYGVGEEDGEEGAHRPGEHPQS